jgi:L-iditol 2-dehydrogenase
VLGPGRAALEEGPTPRPGPGEVLLAPEAALTGGTVLKVLRRGGHARLGAAPLPLGHEGSGRIVALGDGVTGWHVGERVVPGPSGPCGACAPCRAGREPLCHAPCWWSGLFADLVAVPRAVVLTNLHRVSDGLAPERAALADNLACVLHGLEASPARPGERALVLGTGPLGLLWTWALAEAGASVTLVGRRREALEVGRLFGAERAVRLDDLDAHERFDLLVEAVGVPETWSRTLTLAAPGARVNLFGGVPVGSTLTVDATRLHYEELTLTASFHYGPRHLAAALQRLGGGLGRGGLDLAALLLGDVVPLADLPRWLGTHLEGPSPRKAVVRP